MLTPILVVSKDANWICNIIFSVHATHFTLRRDFTETDRETLWCSLQINKNCQTCKTGNFCPRNCKLSMKIWRNKDPCNEKVAFENPYLNSLTGAKYFMVRKKILDIKTFENITHSLRRTFRTRITNFNIHPFQLRLRTTILKINPYWLRLRSTILKINPYQLRLRTTVLKLNSYR